jgi:hypothetical protein
MPNLIWWPLIAAILHIVEEFVFPGGFADWDRAYRPAYKSSITPRLHIVMNGLLLFACVAAGSAGATPGGVSGWLTLAALLASNAVFHLVGAVRTRRYSPGMVTGLLLYIPMAVYGFAHFLSTHQASTATAVIAAAIGGSYHLWSAMAHARRAKAAASVVLMVVAMLAGSPRALAASATPPERIAAVIETYLSWAVEGKDFPAEPPKPLPALPHRSCAGQLDPQHLPAVIYVAWQLSAEAQHAACNWKYDLATHHATQLTAAEAADAAQHIAAGTIPQQERAFFHAVPQHDGKLVVTMGYCWGSAKGTFAFTESGPVLIGELSIHGY